MNTYAFSMFLIIDYETNKYTGEWLRSNKLALFSEELKMFIGATRGVQLRDFSNPNSYFASPNIWNYNTHTFLHEYSILKFYFSLYVIYCSNSSF